MNICFKMLNNKQIMLNDVQPSNTILTLKTMIQDKEGIPSSHQRLLYRGKQLDLSKTVSLNLCKTT